MKAWFEPHPCRKALSASSSANTFTTSGIQNSERRFGHADFTVSEVMKIAVTAFRYGNCEIICGAG